MTRWITAAVLASVVAAQAAGPITGPPELAAMRAALVKAAKAHDKPAMAALIDWPLGVDNYGSPPKLTKARFLKNNDYLAGFFGGGDDADFLRCIGSGPITQQLDGKEFGGRAWVADCNGNEFFFAQRGGQWRLTAYQNINE